MGTSKSEISEWFGRGVKEGATNMLVVCDTFDHEDYPVYVKPDEDVHKKYAEYSGKEMQKVMEVYSLKRNELSQLAEFRSFHFD
jgi:hypothetical protein